MFYVVKVHWLEKSIFNKLNYLLFDLDLLSFM